MEILKYVGKIKMITKMMNIFYLVPIIWLTHLIYVAHYGKYSINEISIREIINSFYQYNTWFTILVFSAILILSMFLESVLFPFLVMNAAKKPKTDEEIKLKTFMKYLNKYLFGFEISEIENDIYSDKRGFISNCYKIPVALFLYSLCFYSHLLIMTLLLLLSIYLSYSYFKGLKAYFNEPNSTT